MSEYLKSYLDQGKTHEAKDVIVTEAAVTCVSWESGHSVFCGLHSDLVFRLCLDKIMRFVLFVWCHLITIKE